MILWVRFLWSFYKIYFPSTRSITKGSRSHILLMTPRIFVRSLNVKKNCFTITRIVKECKRGFNLSPSLLYIFYFNLHTTKDCRSKIVLMVPRTFVTSLDVKEIGEKRSLIFCVAGYISL